jgi:hypothetical protein
MQTRWKQCRYYLQMTLFPISPPNHIDGMPWPNFPPGDIVERQALWRFARTPTAYIRPYATPFCAFCAHMTSLSAPTALIRPDEAHTALAVPHTASTASFCPCLASFSSLRTLSTRPLLVSRNSALHGINWVDISVKWRGRRALDNAYLTIQ